MNPLLQSHTLPPFSAIRPEHIEPAIKTLIDQVKVVVNQVVERGENQWDSLVAPIEQAQERLSEAFRRFLT